QLAAHERDLAVELAGRHVDVVLRGHRDSNAGRGGRSFIDRARFVIDHDVPLAPVIAREVELVRRIQALRRVFVEATRHRCEDFFGCSRCCISHGNSSPPGGAPFAALFPPYKRSAPNQNPNMLPGTTLMILPRTCTGDAFSVIDTACCFCASVLTVPSRYASWPITFTVTPDRPAA